MEKHIKFRCRHAALFAAAITIIFTCLPTSAWSGCEPMEILEFAKAGYTQAQIDEICGETATNNNRVVPQQYQIGYRCSTYYGWCPMDAAAPVGSACICYTANGTLQGVVVK